MMKGDTILHSSSERDERNTIRRFWTIAFLIYSLAEGIYIIINYWITRSHCNHCVLPVPFYILQFSGNVLFTALMWYALNSFYQLRTWKSIALNVIVFLLYYFGWVGFIYLLFSTRTHWLMGDVGPRPVTNFIYGSWIDIGKYAVKLSAFYMLRFYIGYRQSERQRIQLAVINKDLQVNLLKQQLSPHFYFNTLNNLYGLARSGSGRLPDALNQLSNIMKYVIVDCNEPKVSLRQEINFLQSYISLEKLRYENDTIIEMKVTGDAGNHQVMPLLLIQFVENAFKHGMKEKSQHNWMKVDVEMNTKELYFNVDNSYYEKHAPDGIGLASVRRILELQYPGRHTMEMSQTPDRFSVTLKLVLL